MKKFKCSCGEIWFDSEANPTCPESDDAYNGQHNHKVKETKVFSADDYAEMWSSDLEDANRHSLTDMPGEVLNVLEKNVKDKNAVRKIMKKLYEKGIGI